MTESNESTLIAGTSLNAPLSTCLILFTPRSTVDVCGFCRGGMRVSPMLPHDTVGAALPLHPGGDVGLISPVPAAQH